MRGVMRMAALIACALTMGSCSEPVKIAVFNNAGREIVVRTDPILFLGRRYTTLAPGEILTTLHDWMLPPGLVIRVGRCWYGYDAPFPSGAYFDPAGIYDRDMKVQVEPDLTVYLLPVTAKRRMPVKELAAVQRDGYPLRPIFDTCKTEERNRDSL